MSIDACNAPSGNGANGAWTNFGYGMGSYGGCPMQTWSGSGTFGYQQASRLAFIAPPGTSIDSIGWDGEFGKHHDCGWSTEIRAASLSHGWSSRLVGVGAGEGCNWTASTNDQTIALAAPVGTNALFQQVECGRSNCAGGGWAWVWSRGMRVVLLDYEAPRVTQVEGPLASGRWQRGLKDVGFRAEDNLGIREVDLTIDDRPQNFASGACNWTRATPCSTLHQALPADTTEHPDGPHTLRVTATDAGGQQVVASRSILTDNTAPDRVDIGVAGGEGWRRRNGFGVAWSNPPEQHAPIAGVRYRICRVGTEECREESREGALEQLNDLDVPASGDWTVQLWRVDEAGNGSDSDSQRSSPVHLRLDSESPELAFHAQDPDDPLKVSVGVSDATSGVASGSIEIRRKGAKTWHEVDAQVEGGRLVGYVDDQGLEDGTYDLRAHATDHAGNTASTGELASGASAGLRLPVRVPTQLKVGLKRTRTVRKVVRRGGRKRTIRRRVTRLVTRGRVGVGRAVTLHGRLTNPDGQPIDFAAIEVSGRPAFEENGFGSLGLLRTDEDGRFTYRAVGTESRILRFHYRGGRRIRSATTDVTLRVPASSTISVSDSRVFNGDQVTFTGRLRGGAIPEGGKLLEVQAYFRSRWRTFSTVRSDPLGRWRFSYQFGGTSGRITYRFRVLIPHEGGYPFDNGRSRVIRVAVRGP